MRLLRSAVSGITTRARAVLHGSPKPATNLKVTLTVVGVLLRTTFTLGIDLLMTSTSRALVFASMGPMAQHTVLQAPAGVFDQERRVQHQVAARNVSALSAFDVVNVNYEDSLETPYGAPAVGRLDCSGQAHVVQATKVGSIVP